MKIRSDEDPLTICREVEMADMTAFYHYRHRDIMRGNAHEGFVLAALAASRTRRPADHRAYSFAARCALRIGRSTRTAISAATILAAAPINSTIVQSPDLATTLASGTRIAAVPLAV